MIRWRMHLLALVTLMAPVAVMGQGAAPLIDTYKAPSLSALTETKTPGGFSLPAIKDWSRYRGAPDGELGPIGQRVDQVVRDLMRKPGDRDRLPSPALLTTTRNAVGPMLMDSEAIFKAAGRLIESAD